MQLAEELGISQGNVSRLEGRNDVYLSTLRSYLQALGGHLEIAAMFDDEPTGPLEISPKDPIDTPNRRAIFEFHPVSSVS